MSDRRYAVRIRRGPAGVTTERIDWPEPAPLERYQTEVGGYVEQAMKVQLLKGDPEDLTRTHGLVVLCDEEGLLKPTPVVTAYRPWDGAPLVGDLLVVSFFEDEDGGNWRPLTEAEAAMVELVNVGWAADAPAIQLDGVLTVDQRTRSTAADLRDYERVLAEQRLAALERRQGDSG
jgi:hypothetical protein